MKEQPINVDKEQMSFFNNGLIYWLSQTATKADISRLDDRIDKLDDKIESVRTELKSDIASLRKSNHAFFFWVIGLMFGGFGTLGGLMLKLLSR